MRTFPDNWRKYDSYEIPLKCVSCNQVTLVEIILQSKEHQVWQKPQCLDSRLIEYFCMFFNRDQGEWGNIGGMGLPAQQRTFSLICSHCGNKYDISWNSSVLERIFEANLYLKVVDDCGNQLFRKEIKERALQAYVQSNAMELLGMRIERKSGWGPDFMTDQGEGVEVEFYWNDYLKHHHHHNPKFEITKYLVVLGDGEPQDPNKRKLLPVKIIHVAERSYEEWKVGQHGFVQQRERTRYVLANLGKIIAKLYDSHRDACAREARFFCLECEHFPRNIDQEAIKIIQTSNILILK